MLCGEGQGQGGAHGMGEGGWVSEGTGIKPHEAGPVGQGEVGQGSLILAIITSATVMDSIMSPQIHGLNP